MGSDKEFRRGLHGIDYYPNHIPSKTRAEISRCPAIGRSASLRRRDAAADRRDPFFERRFRKGLTNFSTRFRDFDFEKVEETFLKYDHILFGSLAHDISYAKGFACQKTNLTEPCLKKLQNSWRLKPLLEYSKNVQLAAEWFLRLSAKKPSLAITWMLATHYRPPTDDVVEIGDVLAGYPQARHNLLKAGNDVARSIMTQAGFDVLDAELLTSMARRSWFHDDLHFHFCHMANKRKFVPGYSGGLGRMIAHAYFGMLCPSIDGRVFP